MSEQPFECDLEEQRIKNQNLHNVNEGEDDEDNQDCAIDLSPFRVLNLFEDMVDEKLAMKTIQLCKILMQRSNEDEDEKSKQVKILCQKFINNWHRLQRLYQDYLNELEKQGRIQIQKLKNQIKEITAQIQQKLSGQLQSVKMEINLIKEQYKVLKEVKNNTADNNEDLKKQEKQIQELIRQKQWKQNYLNKKKKEVQTTISTKSQIIIQLENQQQQLKMKKQSRHLSVLQLEQTIKNIQPYITQERTQLYNIMQDIQKQTLIIQKFQQILTAKITLVQQHNQLRTETVQINRQRPPYPRFDIPKQEQKSTMCNLMAYIWLILCLGFTIYEFI